MSSPHSVHAYTLIEVVTTIVILGIAASFAVPSLRGTFGRAERQAALSRIAGDLFFARMQAIRGGRRVMVQFDSTETRHFSGSYRVTPVASAAPIKHVDLGLAPGQLKMGNARRPLVFNSRGLLVGASNRKIWVELGGAADSLVVSRLGRVYRTY